MEKSFRTQRGNSIDKRKAREHHACDYCGASIKPNTEYYCIRFKGDDYRWHTKKRCEDCWDGKQLSANNEKTYKSD